MDGYVCVCACMCMRLGQHHASDLYLPTQPTGSAASDMRAHLTRDLRGSTARAQYCWLGGATGWCLAGWCVWLGGVTGWCVWLDVSPGTRRPPNSAACLLMWVPSIFNPGLHPFTTPLPHIYFYSQSIVTLKCSLFFSFSLFSFSPTWQHTLYCG